MKHIALMMVVVSLVTSCSFVGSRKYKPPTAEGLIEKSQEQCEMLGYDVATKEFRDCTSNIYNKMLDGKSAQ